MSQTVSVSSGVVGGNGSEIVVVVPSIIGGLPSVSSMQPEDSFGITTGGENAQISLAKVAFLIAEQFCYASPNFFAVF